MDQHNVGDHSSLYDLLTFNSNFFFFSLHSLTCAVRYREEEKNLLKNIKSNLGVKYPIN